MTSKWRSGTSGRSVGIEFRLSFGGASFLIWQTRGRLQGDVLDIGCGLGDNAIYLAKSGYDVTGSDISPTALITPERRAKDAGVEVKFAVADSTKLDGYTDAFDTIVDSGMSTH